MSPKLKNQYMALRHGYKIDCLQDTSSKEYVSKLLERIKIESKMDPIISTNPVNQKSPIEIALLIHKQVFDEDGILSENEFHEINQICLVDPFWRKIRQTMIRKFFSDQPMSEE